MLLNGCMKTLKLNYAKQQPIKKSGFTIIEVVLVLAIAGLIFLMVFIALPALQRTQRDSQRKNDMSRLADAISRWTANNARATDASGRLNLPYAYDYGGSGFNQVILNGYLKANQGEFSDPDGSEYRVEMYGYWGYETSLHEPEEFDHTIYISGGVKCNGENLAAKTTGAQTKGYVIQYKLEGGGKICLDNSNSIVRVPREE